MRYDDSVGEYLAKLRDDPPLFTLRCPDCPGTVTAKGENHARLLLAIHQEGTCQGGRGVSRDDASDSAPDPPADVLQVTPPK